MESIGCTELLMNLCLLLFLLYIIVLNGLRHQHQSSNHQQIDLSRFHFSRHHRKDYQVEANWYYRQ